MDRTLDIKTDKINKKKPVHVNEAGHESLINTGNIEPGQTGLFPAFLNCGAGAVCYSKWCTDAIDTIS